MKLNNREHLKALSSCEQMFNLIAFDKKTTGKRK